MTKDLFLKFADCLLIPAAELDYKLNTRLIKIMLDNYNTIMVLLTIIMLRADMYTSLIHVGTLKKNERVVWGRVPNHAI